MKKLLFAFILTITIISSAFTQSFEGKIVYKIEYTNISKEVEGYKFMLPKTLSITIKGKKNRIDQMTMGIESATIYNYEDSTSIILANSIFSEDKTAILLSSKEVDSDNAKSKKEGQVKIRNEKQEIAGYKCKKALVTNNDGTTATVWFTKEIPKLGNMNQQVTSKIDGFYMKLISNDKNMTMTITAISVEKKEISDSLFEVPEGYTTLTLDEFNESQKAKASK